MYFQSRQSIAAKIAFDTPGSTIDRKFAIDFLLNKMDQTVSLQLMSPWKKASLAGKYTFIRSFKDVYFLRGERNQITWRKTLCTLDSPNSTDISSGH